MFQFWDYYLRIWNCKRLLWTTDTVARLYIDNVLIWVPYRPTEISEYIRPLSVTLSVLHVSCISEFRYIVTVILKPQYFSERMHWQGFVPIYCQNMLTSLFKVCNWESLHTRILKSRVKMLHKKSIVCFSIFKWLQWIKIDTVKKCRKRVSYFITSLLFITRKHDT